MKAKRTRKLMSVEGALQIADRAVTMNDWSRALKVLAAEVRRLTAVQPPVPLTVGAESSGETFTNPSAPACGVPHPQGPHITCKLAPGHADMHTDPATGLLWDMAR